MYIERHTHIYACTPTLGCPIYIYMYKYRELAPLQETRHDKGNKQARKSQENDSKSWSHLYKNGETLSPTPTPSAWSTPLPRLDTFSN